MKRFLTIAALAATLAAGCAQDARLGVVNFANGSAAPAAIPQALLSQATGATTKPGHVVLLRAGASPVGGAAFNFVLSGERAASVRNALVKAGIPRRKIVSQYVGIVHRGSPAKDRAVIVDATTRAALASGKQVVTPQVTRAQIRALQAEIAALQAQMKAKAAPATVAPKPARVREWTGGAFYLSRTASVDSTTTIPSFGSGAPQSESYGDTYNGTGYGFSLNRRPFLVWRVPVHFGMRGVSQQWQAVNPVLQGTTVASMTPGGYLIRPLLARDSVATQFIQANVSVTLKPFGVTVSPGVAVGWLGAQSLAGGETAGAGGVTYANLTSTNGSSVGVTPSLRLGYGPVSLSYSQSPWGTGGYDAPRVIMGTVIWGHLLQVKGGVALPDCPSVCQDGAGITAGKIVSLTLQKYGWDLGFVDVMGEKFVRGGATVPATLAQAMAPYDPSRPWNSYNPGVTVTLTKNLTRNVQASVSYSYEGESGMGYSAMTSGLDTVQSSAVIKTTEISLKSRF